MCQISAAGYIYNILADLYGYQIPAAGHKYQIVAAVYMYNVIADLCRYNILAAGYIYHTIAAVYRSLLLYTRKI